ncbi:hypothetical protein BC332_25651 [Capsicum chinense]|nr:hypothetical protein BC332_25651 [Capsicum chinense]
MGLTTIGQLSLIEAEPTAPVPVEEVLKISYVDTLKPAKPQYKSIPLKQIVYLHGEPRIVWKEEEVEQMIINEDWQFIVIGKFSYGWLNIHDLRRLIPKQCDLKGEVNIGLLSNRHILIRAIRMDDYVHLLSKPKFYVTNNYWSCPRRTHKWDTLFDLGEETSIAIAWISFLSLPPIFLKKKQCSHRQQQY